MAAQRRATGTAARPARRPTSKGRRAGPAKRQSWREGFHLPRDLWFDLLAVLTFLALVLLLIAALPVLPDAAVTRPVRELGGSERLVLGGATFLIPAILAAMLVEYVRAYRFDGPRISWLRYSGAGLLLLAWSALADIVQEGRGGAVGADLHRAVGDVLGVFGWLVWLGAVVAGLIWLLRLSLPHFWLGARGVSLFGRMAFVTSARAATGSARAVRRRLGRPSGVPAAVALAPVPSSAVPPKPVPLPVIRSLAAPARAQETSPPRRKEPSRTLVATSPAGLKWTLPETSMLRYGTRIEASQEAMYQRADTIVRTLADFGIAARVQEIRPGPTVTQFGVRPDPGVKVSRIVGLQNDLALSLEAHSIRVEAPVPGKPYVGIEVPNPISTPVTLRELLESQEFARARAKGARLPIAVGSDVAGEPVIGDLTRMPHLLIAGATGAGKSVFINALISCLLFQCSPEELQVIMVDPKQVELTGYNGVPHLKAPVIVDADKVVGALDWCIKEMERRYGLFAKGSFRDILRFNQAAHERKEAGLPYLLVIIDELADLMMTAPDQVEQQICRLAQKARATGIHLVVATQRPSVDVITGLIKANFPSRIAFAVSSGVDSKTILDSPGAERLLGRGDMLYTPADALRPIRVQGTYVHDEEIESIIKFWRDQRQAQGDRWQSAEEQRALLESWSPPAEDDPESRLFDDAVAVLEGVARAAREQGREPEVTVSLLQRRLRVGQSRATLLMDELFDQGLVGQPHGPTRARRVTIAVEDGMAEAVGETAGD